MHSRIAELINGGAEVSVLIDLFQQFTGRSPEIVEPLPASGSGRKYYRIRDGETSVIGAYNPDAREHDVFIALSRHFLSAGLPVPLIYMSKPDSGLCLLQDLGDETLLDRIEKERDHPHYNEKLTSYYSRVLSDLIRFQLDGDKHLNYSRLIVPEFNMKAMHWDMNYFKYYFLKPSGIVFNEYVLEQDFERLALTLHQEKLRGFMYRDFQARNIMIHHNMNFYIDYQGGRKGPLQYDVVSLLFQAKAAIPEDLKMQLLDYYIRELGNRIHFDQHEFRKRLDGFVLIRLLQVMGAYGYRGWFEGKSHFLESIPLLQPNLKWIFNHQAVTDGMPEMTNVLTEILHMMEDNSLIQTEKLIVEICSFSYRRGIPYDISGNGGGFVFDCRLLPNPGKMEQYKLLTGLDCDVKSFLENEPEVHIFVENANTIVQQSVRNYLKSGYTHLQVSFGCTGGKHRSVYCAERLAGVLHHQQGVLVSLKHMEINT